eukprot:Em0001g2210a
MMRKACGEVQESDDEAIQIITGSSDNDESEEITEQVQPVIANENSVVHSNTGDRSDGMIQQNPLMSLKQAFKVMDFTELYPTMKAASGLDGTAFQPDTEKQAVLLKSVPWFHGQISRAESERLLTSQSNGTFLIRDSNTYPGDYTLSLSTSANGASLAGAAPTPEKQNLAISANGLSTGGPENQNPATPANGLFSTGLENQSPAASANCLSSESPEKQNPSALANSRSLAGAAATPKTQNPVRERGLLHNMFSSLRTAFGLPDSLPLPFLLTNHAALCPDVPDLVPWPVPTRSVLFQTEAVETMTTVLSGSKATAIHGFIPPLMCQPRPNLQHFPLGFQITNAFYHGAPERETLGDKMQKRYMVILKRSMPWNMTRVKGVLQRNPIPSGGGYYDYCSKECRDNKQAFGFAILEASSPEYLRICSNFRMDWTKGQCPDLDYVIEVFCGQTQKRWKDYKARLASKGSPTTVEQYYHGTAIKCDIFVSMSTCNQSGCSICGISREGFNKKHLGKNYPLSKNFGEGFYFALHSSKSHNYTQGSQNHRAVLICDVLPGNKYTVTTTQPHLTAPPVGYDSVHFVPNQHTRLKYPEVVLFEEASILPRYIILYTRDGIERIAK